MRALEMAAACLAVLTAAVGHVQAGAIYKQVGAADTTDLPSIETDAIALTSGATHPRSILESSQPIHDFTWHHFTDSAAGNDPIGLAGIRRAVGTGGDFRGPNLSPSDRLNLTTADIFQTDSAGTFASAVALTSQDSDARLGGVMMLRWDASDEGAGTEATSADDFLGGQSNNRSAGAPGGGSGSGGSGSGGGGAGPGGGGSGSGGGGGGPGGGGGSGSTAQGTDRGTDGSALGSVGDDAYSSTGEGFSAGVGSRADERIGGRGGRVLEGGVSEFFGGSDEVFLSSDPPIDSVVGDGGSTGGDGYIADDGYTADDGYIADGGYIDRGNDAGGDQWLPSDLGSFPGGQGYPEPPALVPGYDPVPMESLATATVPEPSTLLIFAIGASGLVIKGARRRRREQVSAAG